MKDILIKKMEILDFAVGSPRETLQQAFTNKIIDDDRWIQMLRVRNQLAHDYDGTFAEKNAPGEAAAKMKPESKEGGSVFAKEKMEHWRIAVTGCFFADRMWQRHSGNGICQCR